MNFKEFEDRLQVEIGNSKKFRNLWYYESLEQLFPRLPSKNSLENALDFI